MNRLQILIASGLCAAAAFGCSEPEKSTEFGSIALQIVSAPVVSAPAVSNTGAAAKPEVAKAPAAATATLALEGVRVTVTGPTNKTASSTTAAGGFFDVTLDQLVPGQYSVIVEGIVSSETDFYGSVTNVTVSSGQTAAATVTNFSTFVPVLADIPTPTGIFNVTAQWSKVPTATGYVLQLANNPGFTGATERSVPDTSATVTAPDSGLFFVRVRAANAAVTKGHATPASTKPFRVVPVPSTLRIVPISAALAGVGTQQTLVAQARDANANLIADVPYVWTSLNANIATVGTSTGQVTAVAAGQATINTAVGTASASATVNVAVTGTPPVNVWSTMPNPAPSWLWSTWGLSPSNVYAVGSGGTILSFNGTAWSAMTHPAGTSSMRSIWGTSSSDLFAASEASAFAIMHYNGMSWTPMTTPASLFLYGVWGSASNDVFAVGDVGKIIHYDGTAWTAMTSGTGNFLWHVWGSSAKDVFAVGVSGTLLHYDGTAWTPMTHPAGTTTFYRVWGTASDNVFVVGTGGTILRYNGVSWSSMTSGTVGSLYGVAGTSSNEVFASGAGGTMLRFNGTSWSPMATETTQPTYSVWASPGGPVFGTTENGTLPRVVRGGRGAAAIAPGEPTLLGTTNAANWATDFLITIPVTFSSTTEVTTLAMIGRGPATSGRLALYSDAAGLPNQLLAQTGVFAVSGADPTTYEIPVVQQARVPAGSYWFAFIYNNGTGTPIAGVPTGGPGGYRYVSAFGFGTAFPATFPASTAAVSTSRFNYYARGFVVP